MKTSLLALCVLVTSAAEAQLSPTIYQLHQDADSTVLVVDWSQLASPPPYFTTTIRDTTGAFVQTCFADPLTFGSANQCFHEPVPTSALADTFAVATPIADLDVYGWVRPEGQAAEQTAILTIPPWVAPTPPATRVFAPDSTTEGGILYAGRVLLDYFADLGYRALIHPGDSTVNWGVRREAAQHCRVSENLLAAVENGQTAYIPSRIRNCLGDHLGQIINSRNLRLWAGVIRSWVP